MASGSRAATCIPNFFVQHDAHRGIDGIFFALTSAAEDDAGSSNLFALHAEMKPASRARHLHAALRACGNRVGIINDSRIPAL